MLLVAFKAGRQFFYVWWVGGRTPGVTTGHTHRAAVHRRPHPYARIIPVAQCCLELAVLLARGWVLQRREVEGVKGVGRCARGCGGCSC